MKPVELKVFSPRSRCDLFAAGLFSDGASPVSADAPVELEAALTRLRKLGFGGRQGEVAEQPLGESGARLLALGLGETANFDRAKARQWLDRAIQAARARYVRRLVVVLPDHPEYNDADGARRVFVRIAGVSYRYDQFRQEDRIERKGPESVAVLAPGSNGSLYRRELSFARTLAAGITLARDLANAPPNLASPAWIAEQSAALAKEHGMRRTVWGPAELRRRGMGGLLAVGGGSANPPRLLRLDWGHRGPRIALVGKGVTFDTGGISIKPAAAMDEMKFDKCGACAVLGIAATVASLALPVRLSCFLPLAENMPDAASFRPGDIVRCYNGKTVEIINTDAEGRMILADALSLAVEGQPDHLIELSTLTGAAVVAVGEKAAALYSPDDRLATQLLDAAAANGERMWRMPLWPENVELMKGRHADLKNSGERWGGANTAAAFLGQFVGGHPSWAHLDIAGPAYSSKPDDGWESGATGYGVATVVAFVKNAAVPSTAVATSRRRRGRA